MVGGGGGRFLYESLCYYDKGEYDLLQMFEVLGLPEDVKAFEVLGLSEDDEAL